MKKVRVGDDLNTASRRKFLKTVGGAAALSTIGVKVVNASASDLPRLAEDDPAMVVMARRFVEIVVVRGVGR